jgi:DNA-binding MarR family transcriptional regulator
MDEKDRTALRTAHGTSAASRRTLIQLADEAGELTRNTGMTAEFAFQQLLAEMTEDERKTIIAEAEQSGF